MKPWPSRYLRIAADDPGTLYKGVLYFRIHNQIHITLTISCIGICQSVILLRQNLQALGEQYKLLCMDGNLTGLRLKYDAFDSDDITDIQLLECLVFLFAYAVTCNVALDTPLKILHVAEGGLSHDTF